MRKKKWKSATMTEAVMFAQRKGKIVDDDSPNEVGYPDKQRRAAVEQFCDGTAIACLSQWKGPYSEVIPDIDAKHPLWWIYS